MVEVILRIAILLRSLARVWTKMADQAAWLPQMGQVSRLWYLEQSRQLAYLLLMLVTLKCMELEHHSGIQLKLAQHQLFFKVKKGLKWHTGQENLPVFFQVVLLWLFLWAGKWCQRVCCLQRSFLVQNVLSLGHFAMCWPLSRSALCWQRSATGGMVESDVPLTQLWMCTSPITANIFWENDKSTKDKSLDRLQAKTCLYYVEWRSGNISVPQQQFIHSDLPCFIAAYSLFHACRSYESGDAVSSEVTDRACWACCWMHWPKQLDIPSTAQITTTNSPSATGEPTNYCQTVLTLGSFVSLTSVDVLTFHATVWLHQATCI